MFPTYKLAVLTGGLLGFVMSIRKRMEAPRKIAAVKPAAPGAALGEQKPANVTGRAEIEKRGLTRSAIIAAARQAAGHRWVCSRSNQQNSCVTGYRSDWRPDETVSGVAYNWGGIDSPARFDAKLQRGYAAGAHSWHGVNRCSAGIDCSGFVSWCWGIGNSHAYTTRNLYLVGRNVQLNPFRDLLPGDALVKPGSHTVLFAGYRPDGSPTFYEAQGAAGRVILNSRAGWSYLRGYYPVRLRWVID